MNRIFQKKEYNGFGMNGTLMSRLRFSGVLQISEKNHISKNCGKTTVEYWSFVDEYGAHLSCFDESLANKILPGEVYEVSGEVKIAKGGTFLNVKQAKIFRSGEYIEEENYPEEKGEDKEE